jgi:hypothetical protein
MLFTCELCDCEYVDHPLALPPHICGTCDAFGGYPCPGCHSFGACEPGCIDAEILRAREERDDDADPYDEEVAS